MKYEVDQVVVALVDDQGMKRDEQFVVRDVAMRRTFVGTFLTYTLRSVVDGRVLHVGNGHLVLAAVRS